ncbi:uncharacterized protein IL334_004378 [Kwoniella shivajii]|uniref:Septin-type G domain-containing protein n=1 Tax=Kwoniella shivajii TaxID=564305 RepID=A0ABZ1D466_9TREE|nr:hypothetical protein IL334_004378 [Kwoniella shivajii]
MAPSFLRKRGRPESQSIPNHDQVIRQALSLPDLTTPLLDISSWEEVPPFTFTLKKNHNQTSESDSAPSGNKDKEMSYRGRGKKPSLVGGNPKDIQFRRPFTPMMITPTSNSTYNTSPRDFRQSIFSWGNEEQKHNPPSSWSSPTQPGSGLGSGSSGSNSRPGSGGDVRDSLHRVISRRKGRKKGTVGQLNIVIVGGKNVGKTSFINLFLSSLSESSSEQPSSLPSTNQPTLKPKAYTTISTVSEREKIQVRFIDTPGLDLTMEDDVSHQCRERGVGGLIRMLEDRFQVMCEEEKKVRRMTGGEDGLIHLVVYLLDARVILHPQTPRQNDKIDWSHTDLFEDGYSSTQNPTRGKPSLTHSHTIVRPKVSIIELDIIRRLAKRANVLPILTHSDSLTTSQLDIVKEAVRRDLSLKEADIPGNGFGIFTGTDDVSRSSIDSDQRPLTPESLPSTSISEMPFAIFSPDFTSTAESSDRDNEDTKQKGNTIRAYKWGEANIYDSNHSDFMNLQEAVLGDNSRLLRSTTREVLYERYRTEKLLAKTGIKLRIEERERLMKEIEKV